MAAERLRCPPGIFLPLIAPGLRRELAPLLYGPYCPLDSQVARCQPLEEPKPQYTYVELIAMAILSSPEQKLVLSDIYQYILVNYPYFRTRGPGWRNSIRHNLSLNNCFIKAGKSAKNKNAHHWAINPVNLEDFCQGNFRNRKLCRPVGDSPRSPPTVHHSGLHSVPFAHLHGQPHPDTMTLSDGYPDVERNPEQVLFGRAAAVAAATNYQQSTLLLNNQKRKFDMASLLAPEKQQQQSLNNDNLSPSGLSLQSNSLEHHHHYHVNESIANNYNLGGTLSNNCTKMSKMSNSHEEDHDSNYTGSADDNSDNVKDNEAEKEDRDSSGRRHDEETDDKTHCKAPAASLSSEGLNRSSSPKFPSSASEDAGNWAPIKENSNCGSINTSSTFPVEFLRSQHGHFVHHGMGPPQSHHGGPQKHTQSLLNHHPFHLPNSQHHLLQHNPSLAAYQALFSSTYWDMLSNMEKKSK